MISSSSSDRYEECITLFGLTRVACDNMFFCKFDTSVFFLPVLEVRGSNRGLLSELGAVGSLFVFGFVFFSQHNHNSQILA